MKRDDIEASALFKPLERQEPTRLSSPPFACALRFQGARPRCLRKSCRLFSSETPRQAIYALHQNYLFLHGQNDAFLPALFAVVLLVRSRKSRCIDELYNHLQVTVEQENHPIAIPDFALDKHTQKGEAMGRGDLHF
jgi:hypothetical protein